MWCSAVVCWACCLQYTHKRFTALFLGPPGWAGTRRELLDLNMVQGESNRGRHADHPAGRHSIRTKQCPPPPSPHFFTGQMPFLPPNQQCQSIEGNCVSYSNALQMHHHSFSHFVNSKNASKCTWMGCVVYLSYVMLQFYSFSASMLLRQQEGHVACEILAAEIQKIHFWSPSISCIT